MERPVAGVSAGAGVAAPPAHAPARRAHRPSPLAAGWRFLARRPPVLASAAGIALLV